MPYSCPTFPRFESFAQANSNKTSFPINLCLPLPCLDNFFSGLAVAPKQQNPPPWLEDSAKFQQRIFLFFFRFTWKRALRDTFFDFFTCWTIVTINFLEWFKLITIWCNVIKKVFKFIRIMLRWFFNLTTEGFLMSCNTFRSMIAWLGITCTAIWCHTNLLILLYVMYTLRALWRISSSMNGIGNGSWGSRLSIEGSEKFSKAFSASQLEETLSCLLHKLRGLVLKPAWLFPGEVPGNPAEWGLPCILTRTPVSTPPLARVMRWVRFSTYSGISYGKIRAVPERNSLLWTQCRMLAPI